jgi:hypothetical protein
MKNFTPSFETCAQSARGPTSATDVSGAGWLRLLLSGPSPSDGDAVCVAHFDGVPHPRAHPVLKVEK